MRNILLNLSTCFILILLVHITNAQTTSDSGIIQLQQEIKDLKQANVAINKELKIQRTDFLRRLKITNDSLKNLSLDLANNQSKFSSISTELGVKIFDNKNKAETQIKNVEDLISKNTLYWIIAVLIIALLSFLLFNFLRKQVLRDKTDITSKILHTKQVLEEEGVKLDNKLIELLGTQMQLMKEQRQVVTSSITEEVNHDLALKVADEIIRIQKNLGNMDTETKGLKQLIASVKRIQDNFEANGYDLIDMLNKPYDQGMKVTANFRPDEALKPSEQIITRIIKPQVNFKGVMIQAAQVEVSVGE